MNVEFTNKNASDEDYLSYMCTRRWVSPKSGFFSLFIEMGRHRMERIRDVWGKFSPFGETDTLNHLKGIYFIFIDSYCKLFS